MRQAERYLVLKQEEVRRELERSTERVLQALNVGDDLAGLVRSRPVVSLGAAVVAGFAVGAVAGRGGRALTRVATLILPYVLPYVTPALSRLAPDLVAFVSDLGSARGRS